MWTYAALLFLRALMSKPMVVRSMVLLLDIWPLRRVNIASRDGDSRPEGLRYERWQRVIVEKIPLLALAVATSAATVIIQHRVGAMAGLDALPWPVRAGNAIIGYVAYIWKTVWPTHLAAFYPQFAISPARVAGAALALTAAHA